MPLWCHQRKRVSLKKRLWAISVQGVVLCPKLMVLWFGLRDCSYMFFSPPTCKYLCNSFQCQTVFPQPEALPPTLSPTGHKAGIHWIPWVFVLRSTTPFKHWICSSFSNNSMLYVFWCFLYLESKDHSKLGRIHFFRETADSIWLI